MLFPYFLNNTMDFYSVPPPAVEVREHKIYKYQAILKHTYTVVVKTKES